MKINTKYLKKLNPCEDRFNNWKTQYKDYNGSLNQFLNLKNITHEDKLWVFFRSIDIKVIPLLAADFAESVLKNFESIYPNDNRPRNAIEICRNKEATQEELSAAETAAETAAWSAARSAAWSAASAARNAASAAYSAYSAAMSAAESAARSAAYSAESAARSADQEKIQLKIMKKYLK